MQDATAITRSEPRAKRNLVARRYVAAFLAIQIAVPGVLLGIRWVREGTHPVNEYPLSWQMYSAVRSGEYVGTDAQGEEHSLSTDPLPLLERGQGYGDAVPAMLCDANPDIVSIHRENAHPSLSTESYPC